MWVKTIDIYFTTLEIEMKTFKEYSLIHLKIATMKQCMLP